MTSIRFPKIGMITKRADGSFDIDPIPGLGGPFEITADYITAWTKSVKFPLNEAKIRAYSPPHIADELVTSIHLFPDRIKENLGKIIIRNEGPSPLYHTSFLHSNVIVVEKYNILSIIDWENTGTVPWEMVEFPLFLYTVPRRWICLRTIIRRESLLTAKVGGDGRNEMDICKASKRLKGTVFFMTIVCPRVWPHGRRRIWRLR